MRKTVIGSPSAPSKRRPSFGSRIFRFAILWVSIVIGILLQVHAQHSEPVVEASGDGNISILTAPDESGASLETTADLQTWHPVGRFPEFRGNHWLWNLDAMEDKQFFRLRRPNTTVPIEDLAPPLDRTRTSGLDDATSFLFEGPNAVQIGVDPSAMKGARRTVLRGRVFLSDGSPLPGVQITVLESPEFGLTSTRQDGQFDLVVNGGGFLTVVYAKLGYCPVQRQIATRVQDYVSLPDVILVPADPVSSAIEFGDNSPLQVHEASMQSDADGNRHAVLLFKPGTRAEMDLPDGSVEPLLQGTVRVTEFTVGESGPEAMPAQLPGNSLYTYCAEFAFDEALQVGALEVRFNQAVISYVENFLNFPVGTATPVGSYDYRRGVWVAEDSGQIIRITSVAGGIAELDIDGDGNADGANALASLGIDVAERQQLASLYTANQTLWRTPLDHFTVKDINWPGGQGGSASGPPDDPPQDDPPPDSDDDPPAFWIQSQRVFSEIGVVGTPYGLHYDSSRTRGYASARQVYIPLSSDDFFGAVERIELKVEIAGRVFLQEFGPEPDLATIFEWDGLDAYGREVQGAMPATITITYIYTGEYNATTRFALNGIPVVLSGSPTRDEVQLTASYIRFLGNFDVAAQSVGGWTFNVHHFYDPARQHLYLGDGSMRTVSNIATTIRTLAGTGEAPSPEFENDGIAATESRLGSPWDIAAAPDGSFVFGDSELKQIFRIDTEGVLHLVAGTGVVGYSGDGGPAESAQISSPYGIDVAPDGTIYFCDFDNDVVRSIIPDGTIHTVAGTGVAGSAGDGGPATQAQLRLPIGLDYGNDGTLYIADANNHRIRAVATDGTIRTLAGTGAAGFSGDGEMATNARLTFPLGVAADSDGNVYIGDTGNACIRRVTPDGVITTIAGDPNLPQPRPDELIGDGGPAIQGRLHSPTIVKVDRAGNLLINDPGAKRIRMVSRSGMITTVVGSGTGAVASTDRNGDGGAALRAVLGNQSANVGQQGSAFAHDGSVVITDSPNRRVRRVGGALPTFTGGDIAIPSLDGREVYRFDSNGRHQETVNALTADLMYTFQYNDIGELIQIVDGDGLITEIARDGQGYPISITGPFGHVTALSTDLNGRLSSVIDTLNRAYTFEYDNGGLLLSETNPEQEVATFSYNDSGRVTQVRVGDGGLITLEKTETPDDIFVTLEMPDINPALFSVTRNSALGEVRTYTDPAGLVFEEIRGIDEIDIQSAADGTVRRIEYEGDPRFDLASPIPSRATVTLPEGETTEILFTRTVDLSDPNDLLSLTSMEEVRHVNGDAFVQTFDPVTRTFTETWPEGRTRQHSIDHMGRMTSLQLGDAAMNTFTYNDLGQLVAFDRSADDSSRSTRYEYDDMGQPITWIDALDRETNYEFDDAGQIRTITFPGERTIEMSYDGKGNLTRVQPPGTSAFQMTYTDTDLLSSFAVPGDDEEATTTHYRYNSMDRLTAIELPEGPTATFTWDNNNRLTERFDGSSTNSYVYSSTTGLLEKINSDQGPSVSFKFDGELVNQVEWSGPIEGTYERTLTDRFRTAQETVNGDNPITFTYDADGLMQTAGDLTASRTTDIGRVTQLTLEGVTEHFDYSSFGELISQRVEFDGITLLEFEFAYDALGRVISKVESIGGVIQTFTYQYDEMGWLSEVESNGVVVETYAYDSLGNIIGRNGLVGTIDDQGRMSALGGTNYNYTASGHLSQKTINTESTHYTYDAFGGLRSVHLPNGTEIDYLIDGASRRVGKSVNGELVRAFLYSDALRIIAELDSNDQVISRFVYFQDGTLPAYMMKDSSSYRLIYDLNGSLRLVVRADTGAIEQRIDYDAFGLVLQDTSPGFQPFAYGGLYDPDTGFVRNGARDYDASAGRWTARDPIYFRSDNVNLYAYVHNLPVQSYDPLGSWGVGFSVSGAGGYAAAGPGSVGQGSSLGGIGGGGVNGAWGGGYASQNNFSGGGLGGAANLLGGDLNLTNAESKCDFQSISTVDQFDIGIGTITIGTGGNNGTWSLGVGGGLGYGAGYATGTSATAF